MEGEVVFRDGYSATTQIEVLFCSLIPWLELASLVILPSSCWQSLAVIFYFVA